jgi:H+-transporting ATPase
MSVKPEQQTDRPSNASTHVPTTARPSASSASGQPLLSEGDHISINVESGGLLSSSVARSNLAPADQSFIGMPAHVPGGDSDELAGLSQTEAARLLVEHGRNEIPEHDTPWYQLLGKQFVGVMPFMLEIAALVSAVIPDWADFGIIMAMLIINALIGFHEEHKAKQSLDALKSQMTATVPVKRDGAMIIRPAAELVPGDIVFLRGGNVVPADCYWLEGDEMQVDTAALTGEPIPRKVPRPDKEGEEPRKGKELLSGCIIKQGEAIA